VSFFGEFRAGNEIKTATLGLLKALLD